MKKVAWLLFALVLVMGCNKAEDAGNKQINEVVVVGETENNDLTQTATDDSVKDENEITIQSKPLSETYNSSGLETVETVVAPYTELKKDSLMCFDNQDVLASDFGWVLNKKRIPYYLFDETSRFQIYEDEEKDQIEYITSEYPNTMITNCDRNKKTIEGYQIITTPNNMELKYNFVWQYYDEINDYAYTYYTLENTSDFFTIPSPTQQPMVDLLEMKDDPNVDYLSSVFEAYINNDAIIDAFDEKNKNTAYGEEINEASKQLNDNIFKVINYVKGNFVNSGYDEYLVFFNRGMQFENEFFVDYMSYIELGACVILKDGIIIQSYGLPGVDGLLDFAWYYDQDNRVKPKRQDFATRFIQGWVGDFNKNGKNEIIIEDLGPFGSTDIFVLEFDEDHFVRRFLMDFTGRINTLTYDWGNESFICEYGFTQHVIFDKTYRAIIKWSEKENCYIHISNEQI